MQTNPQIQHKYKLIRLGYFAVFVCSRVLHVQTKLFRGMLFVVKLMLEVTSLHINLI